MRSNAWMGLAAIGAALALGGCSNETPQPLGMTRGSAIDQVTVAHAPLTVPPDYNVRPPAPGAAPPPEGTAAEPAQTPPAANNAGTAPATGDAASGAAPPTGDTASGTAQSAGEVALLQNAGAAGIDPGIREQIGNENSAQVERDPAMISHLVLWRTAQPEGQLPVLTTRKTGIF